jgi:hypothetical protein
MLELWAPVRHGEPLAHGPADVDAIADLPALLCESYRDLGAQGVLRRSIPR